MKMKMPEGFKRFFALLLCVAMVLPLIPLQLPVKAIGTENITGAGSWEWEAVSDAVRAIYLSVNPGADMSSELIYDCGNGLSAGGEISCMTIVEGATAANFTAFTTAIKAVEVSETVGEGDDAATPKKKVYPLTDEWTTAAKTGTNYFASFRTADGKYKVYTYFLAAYSEIRIIVDSQVDTAEGYKYTSQTGKTVEPKLVLWGLPQAPDGHKLGHELNWVNMVDYGAMTVMLMPDNSLFIHDGGDLEQWSDAGCADFLAFCRDLTGTSEGEKMVINTWALSHAHHDHFRGFWRFLGKYHDQFDLKNVMYNIDRERTGDTYDITGAMKLVREVYPNVRYYKPHTGEKINIAGVTVEILYTHEDRFKPNDANELIIDDENLQGGTYREGMYKNETTQTYDFNDTSTVMKFTFNPGATNETDALLYGDLTKGTSILMEMHASSTLIADIVTVPHHGQNDQSALMAIARTGGTKVFLQHQHKGLAYGGDGDLTKQDMYGTFVTKVRDNFKAMFPEMNYAPGQETANYQVFWAGINTVTIDINTLATTTAPRTATNYYTTQAAQADEYTGWDIYDESDYLISMSDSVTSNSKELNADTKATRDFRLDLIGSADNYQKGNAATSKLKSNNQYIIRKKGTNFVMSYDAIATNPGIPNRATSLEVVTLSNDEADPDYYASADTAIYAVPNNDNLYMNHSYRDQALWIIKQDGTSDGSAITYKTTSSSTDTHKSVFGGTPYIRTYLYKGTTADAKYWYSPDGQDENDPITQYRFMYLKHSSGRQWMENLKTDLQEAADNTDLKRYVIEDMGNGDYLIYWRNKAGDEVHFLACDDYGNWGEKIYTDATDDDYPPVPEKASAELESLKVNLYRYNQFDTDYRKLQFIGVKHYNVEQGITLEQVLQIAQENAALKQTGDARHDLQVPCSGTIPKVGYYYFNLNEAPFDSSGSTYNKCSFNLTYVTDTGHHESYGTLHFYFYDRDLTLTENSQTTYTVSPGTSEQAIRELIVQGIAVSQSFSNVNGTMTDNTNTVLQGSNVEYSPVPVAGKYWLEFVSSTNGNLAYFVNVNYRRTDGSDILVDTLAVLNDEVTSFEAPEITEGLALLNAGSSVTVLDADGNPVTFTVNGEKVNVTVGMLSDSNGRLVNTSVERTYTGLTLTYGGRVICNDFTLTVAKQAGALDQPAKGQPGYVGTDKQGTTTEEDFSKTGVANIQLSATGTPADKGVDLILVMDLSGSMLYELDSGNYAADYDDTRMVAMENSLKEMIKTLQTSGADVRIAMSDFGDLDHYLLDGAVADPTIDGLPAFDVNYDNENYAEVYEFANHLNYIIRDDYSSVNRSGALDNPFGVHYYKFELSTPNYTGLIIPTVYTGSGKVSADAFVDVDTLYNGTDYTASMDSIIQKLDENIQNTTGTNYDVGLEYAYHLGYAIQQDNIAKGEDREIICIFMSDGAPMQYNYFSGSSSCQGWVDWISGNITDIYSAGYSKDNLPADLVTMQTELLDLLKAGTLVRPEYQRGPWAAQMIYKEKGSTAEANRVGLALDVADGYFLYRERYENANDKTFYAVMDRMKYGLDWNYLCRIAWANGITDFDLDYYRDNPECNVLWDLLKTKTLVGYERSGTSYYAVYKTALKNPSLSETQYYPQYTGESTDFFAAMKSVGIDCTWDLFAKIAYKNLGQDRMTAFNTTLRTLGDGYTWGTLSPYSYFYNEEGKNWWAEAIKGNVNERYPVINKYAKTTDPSQRPYVYNGDVPNQYNDGKTDDNDTPMQYNGKEYISGFRGLGIDMYTISFSVADDKVIKAADSESVLQKISSNSGPTGSFFFSASSQDQLTSALSSIISSMSGGATQAFYTDTMGESYDLYYGQVKDVNVVPTVKVMEYALDADRKRTELVNTLETVTFEDKDNDGVIEAYSNMVFTLVEEDGKTKKVYTNIWDQSTGLINGRYVIYNTNTDKSVTLYLDNSGRGFELKPETFFWIIGNIGETDMVLEYQVYLTGSKEGELFTGGIKQYYDTNASETLTYVNYLGNLCTLDPETPRYPWKTEIEKDLYLDKTVEATDDPNKFTLTLEAYSVGETIKFKTTKPADIVLALDQSASMYTPQGATTDKYTYTQNQANNTSLTRYLSTELNKNKAAHLGYYVAQSKTANRTGTSVGDIYDWFIVQYNKDNGQWYYARVTDTTIPVTMRTTDVETYVPGSNAQYFNEANGFNRIICSGTTPIESLYYYESQYAALYESVNSFVTQLAQSGAEMGVQHRIAIAGFASPFYDGISYYDGSGLYIDGSYYLYDTDYMYMGYATTANANGYMLYVSSDEMYNAMAGDLPAALKDVTWSRTVPEGATLIRLDPNQSNKGKTVNGYEAGTYFAAFPATGKQLTDQPLTAQRYANALLDVGVGTVNAAVTNSIEAIRTNYLQTCPAVGLDMAEKIFAANPSTDRDQIVVLFTDGVPTVALDANRGYGESQNAAVRETHYSGFAGAKDAINKANDLKTAGVQIYTIGTSGANAAVAVNYDNSNHGASVNNLNGLNLLKYISSNYQGITATHTAAAKSGDATKLASSTLKLYKDGTQLTSTPTEDFTTYAKTVSDGKVSLIFGSITTEVTAPSETTVTDAILKEIVSDYFDLDIKSVQDIKVYTAAYNGRGDFAEKSNYADKVEVKNLTVTLSASQADGRNDTVNVSGFDFKQNYLSTQGRNGYYGCKLIVEVPVKTREGFWGGNNVPTNDPYTAVYSGDKIVDYFPMPEANVPLAEAAFNVQDKTIYSGQVIQGSELLTGAITVAGNPVTVNANGVFVPQADWMDDYASISWGKIDSNQQEPTGYNTVINSMAPGDYTFVLDVKPNTSSSTNLSYNPSNIVGAFATAKSLEDTGHVFVKVPVLTFKDATTAFNTSAEKYIFSDHLERVDWVFMDDTVDTANAPEPGTAPGLQLTYTPDLASLKDGNIVTDTEVNVTVANGEVELTAVSTFNWIDCGHSSTLGTINTHSGEVDVHEFWVHVSVSLEPDTVVIDFGLDVVIDVLDNDPCTESLQPELNGIGAKDAVTFSKDDVSGTYGKLSVENDHVRYSLNSSNGMQMATEEVFGYQAKYSEMILPSSTVTIIPATSLYFEDNMNFVTYHNGDYLAQWQVWPNEAANGTQDQDRPGLLDGLDANSIYGYDSSYTESIAYSGGSAHKATLDESNSARASFTFTGTGFDIVSLCSKNTGMVLVNVFRGEIDDFDDPAIYNEDTYVVSYFVDTYYGYTYQDGEWNVDEHASGDTMLYQVPVIKADLTNVLWIADDPSTTKDETEYKNFGYDTYTVEIFVGTSWNSNLPTYKSAEFYLDAIRIYNPAGVSGTENDVIHDAYINDGEGWPVYQELRNLFISQTELTDEAMDGILFIDASETPTIKDYISYGPNNEVYLNGISEEKQGQGIAFTLDGQNYALNGLAVDSVHIGLRGLTGTGTVEIYKGTTLFKTITLSTTDMYYDITGLMNEEVTIKNSGTTPVAISNLKVTHKAQPTTFGMRGIVTSSVKNRDAVLEIYTPEQLVDPVVTPKRPALSFNGMVCYNVFFTAEELGDLTASDLGLAVFDSYDPEGTVDTAKDVIMGATLIDGQYMVATNGIHAKYLGDTQYFRVFAKKADGTCVYSKMVGYSAVDYAKNALANSTDVKLKQLVVAMLNYGAEAQKFFGYKTDDLMNKDLTADDQALLAGYDTSSLKAVGKVDVTKVGAFASTGGFAKRSPAISFEGAFEINYFFTPANTVDGDMKLYLWNEETYNSVTELTVENADKIVTMTEYSGVYSGDSDEIAAKYLDKTLYVAAVYESNGVTYCSGVLPYSIAAYCQKPPAGVQALATAAAIYGCTAKQYFSA